MIAPEIDEGKGGQPWIESNNTRGGVQYTTSWSTIAPQPQHLTHNVLEL